MALSCRSFRIIAILVIPGKQPSSGLLQLCDLHLCVLAKLSATVVLFNIFSTYISEALRLTGYPLAPCITSTNVDGKASHTTVPGYHTLSMTRGSTTVFAFGWVTSLNAYRVPDKVEPCADRLGVPRVQPPAEIGAQSSAIVRYNLTGGWWGMKKS